MEDFLQPFHQAGCHVETVSIEMQKPYPFPWTSERFFDAMPESVLGIPQPLQAFELQENKYDLIILGYQPWYLSPSIPTTALLKDPGFKAILKDTPVVTVIGGRNMWINSQEKVKRLLNEAKAILVGNVIRMDKNENLTSVVTILYWMLGGKKDRYLGIFPKPGVADADIYSTHIYGKLVLQALQANDYSGLQNNIIAAGGAFVQWNLMFIELRAKILFKVWASAIIKKKNRTLWLKFFKYYLMIALFVASPIVLLFYMILVRPFRLKAEKKQKQLFLDIK
ncbi:MAG: hypothetical protein HC819_06460 [Cyclobacteriaceae bacterium]|nr:hypothetical protein [Cyclobacteriaceae bacterium]